MSYGGADRLLENGVAVRPADDVNGATDAPPINSSSLLAGGETANRTASLTASRTSLGADSSGISEAGSMVHNALLGASGHATPTAADTMAVATLEPHPVRSRLIKLDYLVHMTRSDPELCDLRACPHRGVTRLAVPSSTSTGSDRLTEHRILLEEVAPSGSSVIDGTAAAKHGDLSKSEWQLSLQRFSSMKHGKTKSYHKLPRHIRRYYKAQDELICAFEDMQLEVDNDMPIGGEEKLLRQKTTLLSLITFLANLVLLVAKTVAAVMSGSLAVVSSVIDSAMDLISGALIFWSARAVKNRDIYQYPQGRTRIEPVAIVVLSVIMALASVQMTIESVEKIISFARGDGQGPVFGVVTICICASTIVIKLVLYLVCRRHDSPGLQTLALDHRNDVLSNSVALTCGLIGYEVWNFADPIGAILISIYIIVSWFLAGWEQIKMLTGYTARPDFLKKVTWVCLNHHQAILCIETVRAFHFGANFIVEVDIVLPERMRVRQAHDIAESLQRKLEHMAGVERAFVHIDYEWEHIPADEHKVV